jgi:hypothetical protein
MIDELLILQVRMPKPPEDTGMSKDGPELV